MHMQILPTFKHDCTEIFDTQFLPLPEVDAYDTYFVDPDNGLEPYWDEDLYDQDKFEYVDTDNKATDQIENDDLITDAQKSEAWINLWTVNPHLPDTSPSPTFQPRPQIQQRQIAVIDDQILPQLQVTSDGLTRFLPLLTILLLKNKRKTL